MENEMLDNNEVFEEKEEENGKVSLFNVLQVCSEFLVTGGSEEATKNFEELKQKLQIRTYLPLSMKENALERALLAFNAKSEDSVAFGTAKEVSLMFHGLLSYVINLDVSEIDLFANEEVYDCFTTSGLFDYIMQFCHFDFYRMEQQYNGMFEYMNVKTLLESLNFASEDSVKSLAEEFKQFKLAQTPDVLKYYAKISEANDPLLNDVAEEIKEKAFEATQEK